MIEKIKTLLWFLQRPSHWAQAVELSARKFRPNYDKSDLAQQAENWAAERAVNVKLALAKIGIDDAQISVFPKSLMASAQKRADQSKVKMGGPGDIDLLYAVTRLSGAKRIVETGVAYGWSSLAILAGIQDTEDSYLVSVDMPYPKLGNDEWVGIVVPDELRENWKIIREPDRNGLIKAVSHFKGEIDMCHYDSDKSFWGRKFGFRVLWEALIPGGIFISDDIQDNLAFKEFVETNELEFAVTKFEGKYVGILRKPNV